MTIKFASKKVQATLLILVAVVAIGLGTVFFLNQKGYFSTQASTTCNAACLTGGNVKFFPKVLGSGNPINGARVNFNATDCNGSGPGTYSCGLSCITLASGQCSSSVSVPVAKYKDNIPFSILVKKSMASPYAWIYSTTGSYSEGTSWSPTYTVKCYDQSKSPATVVDASKCK